MIAVCPLRDPVGLSAWSVASRASISVWARSSACGALTGLPEGGYTLQAQRTAGLEQRIDLGASTAIDPLSLHPNRRGTWAAE